MQTSQLVVTRTVQIIPASAFTIEQLTDAYNQTRVDYMVPMPMNAARLAEYVRVYDVDLDNSVVAVADEQMLGLGMLGVRADRTWITRLGVLPNSRRGGTGQLVMDALLDAGKQLGIGFTILEVIKNNTPAHRLFFKCGFYETRELLILRRPPGPPDDDLTGQVCWLDRQEAMILLGERHTPLAWTNETESLANADNILGLSLILPNGSQGWLTFQRQKFILSRLMMKTTQGDPTIVAQALLAHLYHRYPDLDTHTENIPVDDHHLPAILEAGFVESFSRIEMHRDTNGHTASP